MKVYMTTAIKFKNKRRNNAMDKIAEMSKYVKVKVDSLPSGKVEYKNKAGDPVVGTTTITGRYPDFLLPWANKLGFEGKDNVAYLRHSGNVGTVFHHRAELFFKDRGYFRPAGWDEHPDIQDYEEQADVCFLKLLDFMEDHPDFEPLFVEKVMVSEQYQYGGMIDVIGKNNGKLILLDLKSSNGIFPTHKIQVAGAYNKLCEENGYLIDYAVILRCSRDEEDPYQLEIMGDCDFWFEEFIPLLQSYEAGQIHSAHRKTKEYKEQRKLDKIFWEVVK